MVADYPVSLRWRALYLSRDGLLSKDIAICLLISLCEWDTCKKNKTVTAKLLRSNIALGTGGRPRTLDGRSWSNESNAKCSADENPELYHAYTSSAKHNGSIRYEPTRSWACNQNTAVNINLDKSFESKHTVFPHNLRFCFGFSCSCELQQEIFFW